MRKHPSVREQLSKSDASQLLLGGRMLGLSCIEELIREPGLLRISQLHLGGNYIGDEGASLLVSSPYVCELRELNLTQNNLSVRAVKALAVSPNLHRLEKLNLCNNYLGDDGVAAFVRAFSPPSAWERLCRWLALSATPRRPRHEERPADPYRGAAKSPEASAALAPVSALGTIDWLDLGWNKITDAGARSLASSLLLGQLSYLNMQNNLLHREGVEALAGSAFLSAHSIINVSGNPLSALDKKRLRERLGERLRI